MSDARKKLQDLVERAENGDSEALPVLREILDGAAPQLWQQWGDLARIAETKWLKCIGGKDLMFLEGLERQLATLRSSLAGTDPSPLEDLLVARVAACWLQVHHAEAKYAESLQAGTTLEGESHLQRRLDRAQRRYLASIRTLAQVRRLLRPTVQLNLGQNQVNIAGGSAPDRR